MQTREFAYVHEIIGALVLKCNLLVLATCCNVFFSNLSHPCLLLFGDFFLLTLRKNVTAPAPPSTTTTSDSHMEVLDESSAGGGMSNASTLDMDDSSLCVEQQQQQTQRIPRSTGVLPMPADMHTYLFGHFGDLYLNEVLLSLCLSFVVSFFSNVSTSKSCRYCSI